MPKPAVRVDLTARDMATSALERLNKRLEALRGPATRSQKAIDKFRDVSGLNRLGEGLGRVRSSASSAFLSLGEIVPVLGAITGAASLAGIYRLSSSWASFGSSLGFAAQRIGVSSSTLMSLGGAARIAGSSADSLQSGMQTLGQGMWDAIGGRNPELMAAFGALHLGMYNLGGGLKTVDQVTAQVADKIASIPNPMAQAAVATAFYGSAAENLLPFLRLGSRGMADYQREAIGYGVVNAKGVVAANNLRMAQTRLSLAVEGFGYAVAEKLEPILSPAIAGMANWVSQNRAWIATDIGRHVSDFVAWLKKIDWTAVKKGFDSLIDRAEHFLKRIDDIAQSRAFKTLAQMIDGGQPSGGAPVLSSSGQVKAGLPNGGVLPMTNAATEQMVREEAIRQGADPDRMVALMRDESSGRQIDPKTGKILTSKAGALGLFQVEPSTAAGLNSGRGYDLSDPRQNARAGIEYYQEMKKAYGTDDYATAAYNLGPGIRFHLYRLTHDKNILPNETIGEIDKVNATAAALKGTPAAVAPLTGGPIASVPPGNAQSRDFQAVLDQLRLSVTVDHKNAPPGSSVRVASNDQRVRVQRVATQRAMDPDVAAKGY